MKFLLLAFLFLLPPFYATAQYTRQDTLRGSNGRGRDWWDVKRYDLEVRIDTSTKSISGRIEMRFNIIGQPADSLQLDLQDSLTIDKVIFVRIYKSGAGRLTPPIRTIAKEGNVWWVKYPFSQNTDSDVREYGLIVEYHGKPRRAINPPWDGGFIWSKDSSGQQWTSVACQGLGASSWWPCKDYQGDEPEDGMELTISDTTDLTIVSNGRQVQDVGYWHPTVQDSFVSTGVQKHVYNPINTYNTTFYIGDYAHWHDTLHGEKGILDLDFYPLKYNLAKAKKHWAVTKDMLRCFEYWMGPYPFYEDGYKLVEAPYLGMEHQSAIAYGNEYKMGYRGKDRSGTGVGLCFDFIIVHESGHEWFGNNITASDVADNWLHEGFTSYSETLFAEWIRSKDSAFAYTMGKWALIKNDRPVIGDYGVHKEGSGDIYEKGSAVVHMIRLMINNDSTFRQLLRGLNRNFYHKIVTSKEVEEYISRFVGKDLKAFFDVYLRSVNIPTLTWTTVAKDRKVYFGWKDANPLFKAPIAISLDAGKTYKILQSPDEITYDTYIVRRDMRVKAVGLYKIEEQPQ